MLGLARHQKTRCGRIFVPHGRAAHTRKIAKDLLDGALYLSPDQLGVLLAGFVAAFVSGLLACQWMVTLVRNAQLKYFAYYCFTVGALAIAYHFIFMAA